MEKLKENDTLVLRTRFLRILLIGALIAAILTYFITSPIFIKPLYQSEALIYVPLIIPTKQIEQQGIGLGLTIAMKIAELFGGELIINSEYGKQTEIVARFPSY